MFEYMKLLNALVLVKQLPFKTFTIGLFENCEKTNNKLLKCQTKCHSPLYTISIFAKEKLVYNLWDRCSIKSVNFELLTSAMNGEW